jgi:micrococcal nuclease
LPLKEDRSYEVARVVDGDTIILKNWLGRPRIRLIGVDSPESVHPRKPVECFGVEARLGLKKLLNGEKVRLQFDDSQKRKDIFGRALAYVFLSSSQNSKKETFVNAWLIQEGFAEEYTYRKPYQYQKKFRELEKSARKADVGLWSECQP